MTKIGIGDIIITILLIAVLYALIHLKDIHAQILEHSIDEHDAIVIDGEEYPSYKVSDVEYVDKEDARYKLTLSDGTEIYFSNWSFTDKEDNKND